MFAPTATAIAPPIGVCTIARGRFRAKPKDTSKKLRVNGQIRLSPVRLIDENNEQLGVVETDIAIERAKEAGLDLVEVSPGSTPAVCRIMDYGKWKYDQQKKESKAKSNAKKSELKGMRLRPKIDSHDLGLKLKKAREFLEDGDKVQFVMLFRGREMAHRDLGRKAMLEVVETLGDVSKLEQPPQMAGRRMTMLLTPDRSGKAKKDAAAAKSPVPAAPKPAPRRAPAPVAKAPVEEAPAAPLKPGEAARAAVREQQRQAAEQAQQAAAPPASDAKPAEAPQEPANTG
ncbi:MAG: translation initiation factor IF-3 [Planctomycetota bacterium]